MIIERFGEEEQARMRSGPTLNLALAEGKAFVITDEGGNKWYLSDWGKNGLEIMLGEAGQFGSHGIEILPRVSNVITVKARS